MFEHLRRRVPNQRATFSYAADYDGHVRQSRRVRYAFRWRLSHVHEQLLRARWQSHTERKPCPDLQRGALPTIGIHDLYRNSHSVSNYVTIVIIYSICDAVVDGVIVVDGKQYRLALCDAVVVVYPIMDAVIHKFDVKHTLFQCDAFWIVDAHAVELIVLVTYGVVLFYEHDHPDK